jgi:uncharacterized protein YndB with AHSA1/START domain
MTEALVVHREVAVGAPPSAVFALLTDPDKILRWIGTEATVDARPGGMYLVNVGGTSMAHGTFTEVIPVHRLAYSFGWEGNAKVPPGSTVIEIDLIEQDRGTLVSWTHRGLPDAGEVADHAKGWAHYLDRLVLVAAGGEPGPDIRPDA